jgi:hypothetical protein
MDSQLYVWARKQEVARELDRRALVSQARKLPTNGKAVPTQPGGSPLFRALRTAAGHSLRLSFRSVPREATPQGDTGAVEEVVRRDTMLRTEEYAEGTVLTKEGAMHQNGNSRTWRWSVESGMEDAFQDLLGWMLPGQRGAEIETVSGAPPLRAPVPAETRPAPEPRTSVWPGGRLASEPGQLAY